MLMPNSAKGQNLITGNQLHDVCTSRSPDKFGMCAGYLVGFHEGRNWGTFLAVKPAMEGSSAAEISDFGNKLVKNCIPGDSDYVQIKDVIVKYLDEKPEVRHESARYLVWLSLAEAFPC